MHNDIFKQLGAYVDGELNSRELHKVEKHLDECLICQKEHASLKSLSAVLQEAPLPDFPSEKHFAANVALRLPREDINSTNSKVLEVGWWLAPIGLITAWIFLSTTNLIGEILGAAKTIGLLNNTSAFLVATPSSQANWSTTLGNFGFLAGNNLQWAQILESFTRTTAPQIIFQIAIAILYLSWMAIWWARHTRNEFGQALKN